MPGRIGVLLVVSLLCGLLLPARSASSMVFPLSQVGDRWTPARESGTQITSLRLELYPARDPATEELVWWVDETLVLRNHGSEAVALELAVPNVWSARDASVTHVPADFWAEAFVNGRAVETTPITLVANPAHGSVTVRSARRFPVRLGPGESAHVRVLFALPLDRTGDENRLVFPFHLRGLWDGPIEAGVIVLRWSDQLFGLRTNLPAYAQYRDRVEWFVRSFEPTSDLDVRFLSRGAVFELVAREFGCPRPWELVDRVAEGDPALVRHMLASYRDDQLDLCAELPAALRGSLVAADRAGITHLDLARFAPAGTSWTGPLVLADPTFTPDALTDSEQLYRRFLRNELEARRAAAPR
jgi:hypothetical protein